jgi:hypothetical protein
MNFKINDIVRMKDDGRIYMVEDINDTQHRAPNWYVFHTLRSVGGGGGLYDVESSKIEMVISAREFDRRRRSVEDLPDPRSKFF